MNKGIRNVLLNNIVLHYNNNKSRKQRLKNLKNFGLLEKSLNGGGTDLKVEYNDEKYIFNKLDDSYSSIVSYVLSSIDKKGDCIIMSIDKETNTGTIDNLSTDGIKCSNNLISDIGKHLVKLTIKLLSKYKDKLNINKILLSDHSFLYCKSAQKCRFEESTFLANTLERSEGVSIKNNINLADLYTLKYGNTFYGSLGFLPCSNDKKYKNNYKIIQKLLVKDSYLLYYLNKYSKKYNIDISQLKNYVEINENNKLSEVIKLISSKDNFDKHCHLLNYIIPKLFEKNMLTSFHNQSFEYIISAQK